MNKICVYSGAPGPIQPLLEVLSEKKIPYKLKKPLLSRAFHDYGTVATKTPMRNGVLEDHFGPEDDVELYVREEDEKIVRQLLGNQEEEDTLLR